MKHISIPVTLTLLVSLLVFMSGCSIGPRQLPGNRLAYNKNIQSSDNEEMLLNLIRARNDEPPLFLQIGSVTSSFSYEVDAEVSLKSGIGGTHAADTVTPKTGLGYSERPTVSYTPLQGQDFVSNLLAEIPLSNLGILYRAGWDINVMMWVAVSRLGNVVNLDSFIPTGANHSNTYAGFLKLGQLLAELQVQERLVFLAPSEVINPVTDTVMQVACSPQKADELIRYLGEPAEQKTIDANEVILQFHLTTTRNLLHTTAKHKLTPIRLKSFNEILRELSVEGDPKRLLKSKIRKDHGFRAGLIRIEEAPTHPSNSFVSVKYGDTWFSIEKDDSKSKPIFNLLRTLYSLQAGNIQTQKPLLTLPVAN